MAWRREAQKEKALDIFLRKEEKGPSSVRPTLELFQKQHWEHFSRDEVDRTWAFPST